MYQGAATPAVLTAVRGGKGGENGREFDGSLSAEFGAICAKRGIGGRFVLCNGNGEREHAAGRNKGRFHPGHPRVCGQVSGEETAVFSEECVGCLL